MQIGSKIWDEIHGSLSYNDLLPVDLNQSQIDSLKEIGLEPSDIKQINRAMFNPFVFEKYGFMMGVNVTEKRVFILNFFSFYGTEEEKKEEHRKRLLLLKKDIEKNYTDKDWDKMFCLADKKMIIALFLKFYKEIEDKKVYDLFVDVWTRAENGFHFFTPDVLQYVFERRVHSKEWRSRMNKFKKKFRNTTTIRIFHGEQNNGYNVGDLCSWTLSKKVAEFFAYRFKNEDKGQIYYLDIAPTDPKIIDYITSRSEEEVLMLPDTFISPMGKLCK